MYIVQDITETSTSTVKLKLSNDSAATFNRCSIGYGSTVYVSHYAVHIKEMRDNTVKAFASHLGCQVQILDEVSYVMGMLLRPVCAIRVFMELSCLHPRTEIKIILVSGCHYNSSCSLPKIIILCTSQQANQRNMWLNM